MHIAPPKTGWPPGLLQDDCRALSKWFATRLGARQQIKEMHMSAMIHEPVSFPLDREDIEAADATRAEVDARAMSLAIARRNAAAAEGLGRQIVLSDPPSAGAWVITDALILTLFLATLAFWVSADLRAWGTALARSLFQ